MFKLALKDIRLALSDKRGLMMSFALPIALISLFAFAFGGVGQEKSAPKPKKVVIADEDNSSFSKSVISKLDSLPELVVYTTTTDSAINGVLKGNEPAILIIRKGAGDSVKSFKLPVLEFQYDEGQGPSVAILQGALYGHLARLIAPPPPPVPDSVLPNIPKQEEKASFIKSVPLVTEEDNSPGLVQAVAGTSIMMLLFSVAAIGAGLLDEKSEGTLKRLLSSPISPNHILFGKMIFANLLAIVQLLVMFAFAWLAFGLDIISRLPQLILMILLTAYACSSFGVFLASIARTRAQVQGLSTLIVLVMSAVGGSMVPTMFMPEFMQKLSILSVNYWGIQGFYDVFWRSLPINDPVYLQRLLVLFCIGTGFNTIAILLFRKNLFKLS